ncbi:activating signal cointegrator 1 complex subunit 2 homolog isoform X10 [Eurosta solidaginis]|uniref:activating signal cointegrator 1 complex subunit 2 homolog isoform X10 n=1 Tax=Eurosta solidaginis TaxID=178769 RepID=UPI0035306FE0
METKQSNFQTASKPQSSKMHVSKTPSEVSLTPSQAAEQAKINGLNDNYDHAGHLNSMAQGDASRTQIQYQSKQQSPPHLTQIHPTSQSHQPTQQVTENLQQQQPIYQSQKSSILEQGKKQSYKESHLASDSRKQHYQQQQPMQPSIASVAEPELCTTCPNCQTTIYLVRGHETTGEPTQGSSHMHHDPRDPTGNTAST